jgi:outer membrane protein insertion porin family
MMADRLTASLRCFSRLIMCPAIAAFLLTASAALAQAPVSFSGVTSFKEQELRAPLQEQMLEIQKRGLTPTRADDTAYYLAAFYRSRGYSKVEVNYVIRGGTLLLSVREGPRTLIRSLQFRGNRNYTPEALSPYVSGTEPAKLAEAKLPYSEKELSEAADRVRAFYSSEGFLDVEVETKGTRVLAGGAFADLVLTIKEGTRYTFGNVTFTSGTGFSDAALREALGAKPEGAFTGYTVDAMERSLQSWLRGKGYYAVEVKSVWDKAKASGGRVGVHFEVQRGAQFRIEKITIRGTDRIRPEFMHRRFANLRGDVYDPARVDETYRELQRTGMFRRLRVVPKTTGPNTLDLEVEVEEAKQRQIAIEAGFSSYDGFIGGVRLSDSNLGGWGRPISLRLEYAQRGFRGELLYTDPWFRESEWSLRARLFAELREERGYSRNASGARIDLSREVRPRWTVGVFGEFTNSSLESTGIEEEFLGPPEYVLGAVGLTSTFDYRDDPLNPRRGWILANSAEFNVIAGEYAFSRFTGRYSFYRSIGRSLIAIGVRAGWIVPAGEASDVPIDLRYFSGGATTVRSFAEKELGPRDRHGFPIGGTWYTVANIEWDFPITGALDGALFADAGNLFNDEAPNVNDLRFAIGVGLRYKLPIGPLRIDYGYNPNPREFEDKGALHLSFGFAF